MITLDTNMRSSILAYIPFDTEEPTLQGSEYTRRGFTSLADKRLNDLFVWAAAAAEAC